ncbi:Putative ATPase, AFG1, P-loop containing nucleoside triphosphate hydrolase [Septoria linicola]|uniref:ATPase, AFG1, P-loop containing nucleoside triphosphate hydrolase n=1 Tax=Septoria linicola TaxID=215465 RepID=A0A9Q9EQ37_9PEZI|nr:Putative ATPase, AFG1, P-loop containing nucleoside triphosphate hydrolase [Septoria linicola]
MAASVATGLAITNPLVKYRALLATKVIAPDPAQHRLAIHLAKLYDRLKDYEPEVEYSHKLDQISRAVNAQQRHGGVPASETIPKRSIWRELFAAKERRDSLALTKRLTSHESALQMDSPKGLMLHGEVGTGKSMLIDLFADCLPNRKKRRSHFNTFMLETFAKLEALRSDRMRAGRASIMSQASLADDDYSLLWLAKEMVQTSPILFLDEFQMPDRVASKILTNLMTSFFQLGGVLVATSNRMPEELAKAAGISYAPPAEQRSFGWQLGLGRKRRPAGRYGNYNEFTAFLEVLKARCEVWEVEGSRDFRRLDSGSVAPVKGIDLDSLDDLDSGYGSAEEVFDGEPSDSAHSEQLPVQMPKHFDVAAEGATADTDAAISEAIGGQSVAAWAPASMKVYGRNVQIPRAQNGVSMWTFQELCKGTYGPADYISLASTYHTLVLTEVPVLNWLMKNEARRFITLLDALYECRCKLFVSAAAGPDDIFFPEEQKRAEEGDSGDSVYSETLSEVYQDATAPFRPNVSTQNPNYSEPENEPDYTHARLAGLLGADARSDALEDGTPISRGAVGGSSSNPFGRSFGKTDAEFERKPVDPDEVRYTARPDFQKTSAFTGEDERFAYKRAQSRLWEMCSERWWSRSEEGWHRPTPKEVRRWEGRDDGRAPGLNVYSGSTEIQMGKATEDSTRPPESFKRYDGGPFKPKLEPAKKINIGWHAWGLGEWGKRAGAWGKEWMG